jgi:hypothetical protein
MDRLSNVGMNENYVKDIEELTRKAMKLKQEQNHLRAEQKAITMELRAVLSRLGKKVSNGKVMVKVELEESLWTAFGITDKK